jgi:hypothetical protein
MRTIAVALAVATFGCSGSEPRCPEGFMVVARPSHGEVCCPDGQVWVEEDLHCAYEADGGIDGGVADGGDDAPTDGESPDRESADAVAMDAEPPCGGDDDCPDAPFGSGRCASGRCDLACDPGHDDCDEDGGNGCEADLASPDTCGSCANACPDVENAARVCTAGTCDLRCDRGFGDCENGLADGCEAWVSTASNCGTCGRGCTGSDVCVDGTCGPLAYVDAVSFGSGSGDAVWDVTAGAQVHVAGAFQDVLNAGSTVVNATGRRGGVLLSYGADHSTPTATSFAAVSGDAFGVVATPAVVAVAGAFEGSVDFGGGERTSSAAPSGFVAGYSAAALGYRWDVAPLGDAVKIAARPDGTLLAGGSFSGSITLPDGEHTAVGPADAFVVWLDAAGVVTAGVVVSGPGYDVVGAVTASRGGLRAVALGEELRWPGGMHPGRGEGDVVLLALDTPGAIDWARPIAGDRMDQVYGIAVDGSGTSFVVGTTTSTRIDFGSGDVLAAGDAAGEGFVAAFDAAGRPEWSAIGARLGGPVDIAADDDGFVYITGSFRGSLDYGAGPTSPTGGTDVFVAALGPRGHFRWSRTFGTTATEYATAIALGADGGIVVAGTFSGTTNFGGADLTSRGFDGFVLWLDE